MTLVAIDTTELTNELNELLLTGRFQTNPFLFSKLERRVGALKQADYLSYWANCSALNGIFGKIDEALYAARNAIKIAGTTPNFLLLNHLCVTLEKIGQYKEIGTIVDQLPDSFFEHDEDRMIFMFLSGRLSRFESLIGNLKVENRKIMEIGASAAKILKAMSVDERDVRAMFDLAGNFLAEKKLMTIGTSKVSASLTDNTLSFIMSLAVTPTEAAELEWEYAERLFSQCPNAPANVVHIGFYGSGGC